MILASGGGSTFAYLHDCLKDRQGTWQVAAVVTDRPDAGIFQRAKERHVRAIFVDPDPASSFDLRLSETIQGFRPDLVLLAGFLRRVGPLTVKNFTGNMINSHPSLLPKYGGRGMYGRRVHAAVLAAGDRETGVTVHFVNEHYDDGRVIRQVRVGVPPDATVDVLESLVKEVEKRELLNLIENWKMEK